MSPVIGSVFCDPESDPYQCECPASICKKIEFGEVLDFSDTSIASSVFEAEYDEVTARYIVKARETGASGFFKGTSGHWSSFEEIQEYIAEVTGVPVPNAALLYDFQFQQYGRLIRTDENDGLAVTQLNHMILDLIHDGYGFFWINEDKFDLGLIIGSISASDCHTDRDFTDSRTLEGTQCSEIEKCGDTCFEGYFFGPDKSARSFQDDFIVNGNSTETFRKLVCPENININNFQNLGNQCHYRHLIGPTTVESTSMKTRIFAVAADNSFYFDIKESLFPVPTVVEGTHIDTLRVEIPVGDYCRRFSRAEFEGSLGFYYWPDANCLVEKICTRGASADDGLELFFSTEAGFPAVAQDSPCAF